MSKRFHLTLWFFLVCGSAAFSQNCPNDAVRIKCDAAAQEGITDIQSIDWEVFVNPSWLPLATCRNLSSLECLVTAKPPGIEVLNVENDTLVIRRTSLRASFQNMKFKCTVRQSSRIVYVVGSVVPIDLSVECIWSHVDAVVNLTNHFMKILPRKTVDKVVLFDSSKANATRIGVCRLHHGCQCTLSKRVDQRSALADRLQERQCSILFSPVRDSDEGLGMRVQVHFTDSTRRNLTLRVRLKPKEVRDSDEGLGMRVKVNFTDSTRRNLTLRIGLKHKEGSAAFSQNCPNDAVRIKCDAAAQEGITDIQSIDWEVFVNPSWLPLATCRNLSSLECLVTAKPPGIEVLNVENDTLVIRRTSLRASFQNMKFRCTVRQSSGIVYAVGRVVPIDLSVECIWSHVDAVVNLTNHFMKILPRKTVDKVVLFDSSKANATRIGVCRLHHGCQCTLSKRVDQRSALADRLQERQCSILFSPVRDSDEGLGMRVQVHFTDSTRRNLTLRVRLKPKEVRDSDEGLGMRVKVNFTDSTRRNLTLRIGLKHKEGSAAFSQNCPNDAVRIKCDAAAQEGITDIQSIDWEVFVNPSWLPLATCRNLSSLECLVTAKPPGIEVLNVENDTLVIRRTSLRASFQNMKFRCTVRQSSGIVYAVGRVVPIDLSVECIWSHVDAVVNLTNHFMKILPRKTVDKVVLFDSSKANATRIGVCRLHHGCQCTLSKRVDQRSALADRLQERQCSILFSPVRDSDEGLGMRVQVHFTDSTRRNLTLRVRLKPKEVRDSDEGLGMRVKVNFTDSTRRNLTLRIGLKHKEGSAAFSQNCPNDAVRIKCDAAAQEGITDIQSIDWEVFVNPSWLPLATCRNLSSLECLVTAKPPGIEVLNVENDTLVIRRTSLRASFQNMKFRCTVRQSSGIVYAVGRVVPIDLSVECIWSHVDAVVNLTNHFMKILPRKTVDKVVLFDSSKANATRIGVCRLHHGCQCTLSKRVDQRSALADRLQERQCSILFSPVRDSDEGLGMRVQVHFTDSTRRNLTLRVRLKPKEVRDSDEGLGMRVKVNFTDSTRRNLTLRIGLKHKEGK
ncbi:uncharacterized protein [Acropora muricata]|uniref:uncharacterized protein n=1 Tax=Acropora muricata TaxID=159855 RepID=UPI0034E43C90